MKTNEIDPSLDQESELKPQVITAPKLFLKATLLSLAFVLVMLLITAIGVGIYAYSQLNVFLQTAGLSRHELQNYVETGLATEIPSTNGITTFFILGVDKVQNKANAPILTDTMMLLSLNQDTGEINTISLPRDLWSEEYKTKINALYVYGEERDPEHPENFSREVVADLTNIPINYTIVVSLDMLSELVDTLGGVTIDVPQNFTDSEFPRTDVDLTKTTDPNDIYESISFEKGPQTMDGQTVLKYIRSRHSEGDTGTDVDRTARQQLVITSIAQSLIQKDTLMDPVLIGKVYKWYEEYFKDTVSEPEAVAFGKILFPHRQNIEFTSHPVTIYPENSDGIIEHPPVASTNNQWVYTIKDSEQFKQYFNDMLMKSR